VTDYYSSALISAQKQARLSDKVAQNLVHHSLDSFKAFAEKDLKT